MYINEGFWQKAYMLEFKTNGIVSDAFTFSFPPQSEDFSFPQRINETKTFGGTIIDDYGNDTIQITLSGSTINNSIKKIYCAEKGFKYLSGEEEIFHLQKLIHDYGKIDKLENKSVCLYELNNGTTDTVKWWDGYIKDFKIKRSKESPLSYFYTLDFIAAPKDSLIDAKTGIKWLDDFDSNLKDWLKDISEKLEPLSKWLADYNKAVNIIQTLKKSAQRVLDEVDKYTEIISGYAGTTVSIIKESMSLGDFVIKDSVRIVADSGLNIYVATSELNSTAADLVAYFKDFNYDDVSEDLKESYGKTTQEIADAWKFLAADIEDDSNNIKTLAKTLNDQIASVSVPSAEGDKVILTYGYKKHTIKEGDTFDSLAASVYGDASKAGVIAGYNSAYNKEIKDVTELKPGEVLYLPVLSKEESDVGANKVINPPDVKDNYGSDIDVSTNDFGIKENEYTFINGTENLAQSINNRLSTVVGTKIRDEVYGIRSNTGSSSAASSVIIASIQQTLADEPRIKNVDSIKFKTTDGKLNIDIIYTDINNNKNSFAGAV